MKLGLQQPCPTNTGHSNRLPNLMKNEPSLDPNGFVGHWVLCRWNADAGQGGPHPADAKKIASAGGCTALCTSIEEGYLVLSLDGQLVRLMPFSTVRLPTSPLYARGSKVSVRSSSIQGATTAVVGLTWHFKDQTYVYWLDGTSKRYAEAELDRVET
ncbi:hypothetical protein [Variovorax saccharolyticus]|uniref:hypothetical protein n=1 Tax=Variovorax saccharolyticus TaxID=3053516 RepID=UPI00257629CC|nr:hypothetical protein [Variovorax sp. J22R187]MDM0018020.1 hypothetical protein [Variovorax sp. J22R187]